MARPRRNGAQIAARRQQILDAAYGILLEKGPRALSSRAIAERVGISHMSLYAYFESQPDILRALAERTMSEVRERQREFERQAGEDADAAMRAALGLYPTLEREQPGLFELAWVMPQAVPEVATQARERARENVAHLARIVETGMECGAFRRRDPFLAAVTALGMVIFPLVMFHMGRLGDPALRDAMVAEGLAAALIYLHG